MRILHITDSIKPGGVTSVMRDLVDVQLAKHEVRVGVLRGPVGLGDDNFATVRGRSLLKEVLQADIVHSHHRLTTSYVLALRRRGVVEHIHNIFTDHPYISFRAKTLVCVSQNVRQATEDRYPHTIGHCRVIHNGTPSPPIHPNETDRSGTTLKVTGAGRLCEQKDPLLFVQAIRTIRNAGIRVEAKWYGNGELHSDMVKAVREAGLNDVLDVHRWTSRPELLEQMAASDVFLLSSRWEGLPMTAIEALSVGTPVLCPPIGDLSDLLSDENLPWVYSRDDLSTVLGTVKQLVDAKQDALNPIRENARNIWLSNYNLSAISDQWEVAYCDAII